MRIVVALAVEIGLIAVISQGVVADRTSLLALVLAPAGYLLSYRRRGRRNLVVKVALAAGLLLALARFLGRDGLGHLAGRGPSAVGGAVRLGPGAARVRRAAPP